MSNTAKKKQKDIGELLDKALIQKEEWLFPVPKNWTWVRLKDILEDLQYGYTASSSMDVEGPHYLRITDIQENQVEWSNVPFCQIDNEGLLKYKLYDGDIVVARTGATTGKSYLIFDPPESVFASYLIRLKVPKNIEPRYLWNYMKSSSYWDQITVVKKGSAQPGANAKILGDLKVPLAPLNEQKRIAKKVEHLFTKINEAKQLIEEVMDSFELRRIAVLKSVFKGELIKFDLKLEKLGSIVTLKSGKSLSEDDLLDSGTIPYVKVSDMNSIENQKEIVNSNKFIREKDNVNKSIFPRGTVIFPKRGGAIQTNKKRILSIPAMCDLNIMGIICPPTIHPYYMYYWMQSIDLGSLDNGSSVPQINNKDIEPLLFPLTSMDNQNKVVKLLDNIYEKEDEFIEIIQSRLNQLEELKRSILNKAFQGKLGTNDSTEESGIELMKEVLKSK